MPVSLGSWLRGKKEGIQRNLAMRALDRIDGWGAEKWPLGWVKFRRALDGWKTIVGFVVYWTPDILAWAGDNLPAIIGAFGQEAEQAAPLLKTIGGLLAVVGVVHKAIKFTQPLERRGEERIARLVQVPVRPTSGDSVVKVPLTQLEASVFEAEEAKRARGGAGLETARFEAVVAVKPEVVVPKAAKA